MKTLFSFKLLLSLASMSMIPTAYANGPKSWSFDSTVKVAKVESEKRNLKSHCKKLLRRQMHGSVLPRRYHLSTLPQKCQNVLSRKKKKKVAKSFYNEKSLSGKYTSWGTNPTFQNSSINLANAWKSFRKKKDIVVAVIDTGIDYNHEHLQKNIYVTEGFKDQTNYGVDFSTKSKKVDRTPYDDNGHGTHVAGIVKTVFPDVKLLALKYYDKNQTGQENLNSTIKALEYAINADVDIINYSGGGPEPSVEELTLLKQAEAKGILVVAAAGNERSDIDDKLNAYYPASYGLKNIITVTAYNQSLDPLPSSNWGKNSVDIAAPGFSIKSSMPNNKAAYLSGTSQATAFVTGVAALIKSQYPGLGASTIKSIIRGSAVKETNLIGRSNTNGRLDAQAALQLASQVRSGKSIRNIANVRN